MGTSKREQKKLAKQQNNASRKVVPETDAPAVVKRVPSPLVSESIDTKPFRWTAQSLDHDYEGEWTWKLEPREIYGLLDLLNQLDGLTWREVKAQRTNSKSNTRALHHPQPAAGLCPEAKDRLHELGFGEHDEVFRLRHGNLVRVWGILIGATFYVLWHDAKHRVYPLDT